MKTKLLRKPLFFVIKEAAQAEIEKFLETNYYAEGQYSIKGAYIDKAFRCYSVEEEALKTYDDYSVFTGLRDFYICVPYSNENRQGVISMQCSVQDINGNTEVTISSIGIDSIELLDLQRIRKIAESYPDHSEVEILCEDMHLNLYAAYFRQRA